MLSSSCNPLFRFTWPSSYAIIASGNFKDFYNILFHNKLCFLISTLFSFLLTSRPIPINPSRPHIKGRMFLTFPPNTNAMLQRLSTLSLELTRVSKILGLFMAPICSILPHPIHSFRFASANSVTIEHWSLYLLSTMTKSSRPSQLTLHVFRTLPRSQSVNLDKALSHVFVVNIAWFAFTNSRAWKAQRLSFRVTHALHSFFTLTPNKGISLEAASKVLTRYVAFHTLAKACASTFPRGTTAIGMINVSKGPGACWVIQAVFT